MYWSLAKMTHDPKEPCFPFFSVKICGIRGKTKRQCPVMYTQMAGSGLRSRYLPGSCQPRAASAVPRARSMAPMSRAANTIPGASRLKKSRQE